MKLPPCAIELNVTLHQYLLMIMTFQTWMYIGVLRTDKQANEMIEKIIYNNSKIVKTAKNRNLVEQLSQNIKNKL